MSVNDENIYPWLKEEKAFIRSAIDADRYVIGVCLGAQLIADVLGAKVFACRKKEMGGFLSARPKLAKIIPCSGICLITLV
jgi:GMP synthase-like glutamine amidotransferase